MVQEPRVVMVGPAPELGGGVNAVVEVYRRQGLFRRHAVAYLVSYRGTGARRQLATMCRALVDGLVLLRRGRPRLLHVHSASRGSFWRKSLFCGAAWLLRVPYVLHLHSGEFTGFYARECGAPARRWVRWVLRHAAAVAVVAPIWRDAILAIEPDSRIVVLLNPVELRAQVRPARPEPGQVLFLGRIREGKGVYDLVHAWAVVHASHPRVRLCIAGDGEIDELRRLAVRLGIDASIDFPGWIEGSDKDEALAEADLLVLPSHHEGLPICVLEAMAAGVPVVATAVGGIPDAVDCGRCARLVPPGDPQCLAAAISDLLADAGRRAELARLGRARVESTFSAPRVCQDVEALWQRCAPAVAARANEIGAGSRAP